MDFLSGYMPVLWGTSFSSLPQPTVTAQPATPTLPEVATAAAAGGIARSRGEDRAALSPTPGGAPSTRRAFAAVFEGHGGAAAAERARAQLHALLAADAAVAHAAPGAEAGVRAALVAAFAVLDAEILAERRGRAGGTTAGAALLLVAAGAPEAALYVALRRLARGALPRRRGAAARARPPGDGRGRALAHRGRGRCGHAARRPRRRQRRGGRGARAPREPRAQRRRAQNAAPPR